MEQQIITVIAAIALVAFALASYLRTKSNHNENSDDAKHADARDQGADSPSVSETIAEMRSYFGIESSSRSSALEDSLDLAPVGMLSKLAGKGDPDGSHRDGANRNNRKNRKAS
jgi:hypothetical protein